MATSRVRVRFLEPAAHDLTMLVRSNPQIIRQLVKRLLAIETDRAIGEPVLGDLIGLRQVSVGDGQGRILWRELVRSNGDITCEVAEVWGHGARVASALYAEMTRRVTTLPKNPQTIALSDVIESLGRTSMGLRAPEQQRREPVPEWLLSRLVYTAGIARRDVESLDAEAAMELWERHITGDKLTGEADTEM